MQIYAIDCTPPKEKRICRGCQLFPFRQTCSGQLSWGYLFHGVNCTLPYTVFRHGQACTSPAQLLLPRGDPRERENFEIFVHRHVLIDNYSFRKLYIHKNLLMQGPAALGHSIHTCSFATGVPFAFSRGSSRGAFRLILLDVWRRTWRQKK